MKDGFVKVAAATPKIKVADTQYNAETIISEVKEACADGAKIVVLPELCITGYSCSDLFLQDKLLASAREQLGVIADRTADCDALLFIGMPLEKDHKLFNVAAVVQHGYWHLFQRHICLTMVSSMKQDILPQERDRMAIADIREKRFLLGRISYLNAIPWKDWW